MGLCGDTLRLANDARAYAHENACDSTCVTLGLRSLFRACYNCPVAELGWS